MAIITVTKENFEEKVTKGAAVLVDFWAPWCGYCRRISPAVDQIEKNYDGQIEVGKINIDEQPELAEQYGVNTIPTLILFQNGTAKEPLVAPQSKAEIEEMLKGYGAI